MVYSDTQGIRDEVEIVDVTATDDGDLIQELPDGLNMASPDAEPNRMERSRSPSPPDD